MYEKAQNASDPANQGSRAVQNQTERATAMYFNSGGPARVASRIVPTVVPSMVANDRSRSPP